MLKRLLAILEPQLVPQVQLLTDVDEGEVSIGAKRQRMLRHQVTGRHVCWVDDDDLVSEDYVASLLGAMASNPDCVGFMAANYCLHVQKGNAIYSKKYSDHGQHLENGKVVYTRRINHLTPVRTSIARGIGGFLDLNRGEDTDYSRRLHESGLLKSETFINKVLYTYLYRPHGKRQEQTNERIIEAARLRR